MLQYTVYVESASSACELGRPGVLLSVSAVNNSQLAFRKFHLLTGLPAIVWCSDTVSMKRKFEEKNTSLSYTPLDRKGVRIVFGLCSDTAFGVSVGIFFNLYSYSVIPKNRSKTRTVDGIEDLEICTLFQEVCMSEHLFTA